MTTFWTSHRSAIVTFVAICFIAVAFPLTVNIIVRYYLSHPVIIPLGVRILIGMGAFVRMIQLPIIVLAGLLAFAISATKSALSRKRRPTG